MSDRIDVVTATNAWVVVVNADDEDDRNNDNNNEYTGCRGVRSPTPVVLDQSFYDSFNLIAGIIHNGFALLVFLGYFMANHPQLPNVRQVFTKTRFVISSIALTQQGPS